MWYVKVQSGRNKFVPDRGPTDALEGFGFKALRDSRALGDVFARRYAGMIQLRGLVPVPKTMVGHILPQGLVHCPQVTIF